MLTRLVVNCYSWLIEITLWLFVAGGAFWGYQLGRRMRGEEGAFYGGLFGAAGAFVTSAVIFGGFLLLDEIRKSVRNIEKAQNGTLPAALTVSGCLNAQTAEEDTAFDIFRGIQRL